MLMIEETNIHGLAPIRTVRFIASLIALMGMVFFFLERVLAAVLVMASEGVNLGLARYNNFTGRIAAQNFAEDKKLLGLLKDVNGILPTADSALTILLVISIVLLVIALVGLALPRQAAHVLVAFKLLKWETGEIAADGDASGSLKDTLAKIGNVPLKKIAVPMLIVIGVVLAVFVVRSCHASLKAASVADSIGEMQNQALAYITAQKTYFAQNNAVGGAKALGLPDSLSTDAFEYSVTASRFSAVSKEMLGNCPAGSKWTVSASVKGLFTKELALSRTAPKDSACVNISPDFKKLGRNQ